MLFYRLAEGTDVKALEDKIESVLKKEDMLYVHQLFKEYHLTSFADISKLDLEATIPFEGIVRADFTNLFASAGLPYSTIFLSRWLRPDSEPRKWLRVVCWEHKWKISFSGI